jgi:hypothetical protein
VGACAVWFYLAMLGTKRECVRVAKHHLFGHSLKVRPSCFSISVKLMRWGFAVVLLMG